LIGEPYGEVYESYEVEDRPYEPPASWPGASSQARCGEESRGYEGERRNQNNMNRNEDLAPTI
jgi:hypothetical protein